MMGAKRPRARARSAALLVGVALGVLCGGCAVVGGSGGADEFALQSAEMAWVGVDGWVHESEVSIDPTLACPENLPSEADVRIEGIVESPERSVVVIDGRAICIGDTQTLVARFGALAPGGEAPPDTAAEQAAVVTGEAQAVVQDQDPRPSPGLEDVSLQANGDQDPRPSPGSPAAVGYKVEQDRVIRLTDR